MNITALTDQVHPDYRFNDYKLWRACIDGSLGDLSRSGVVNQQRKKDQGQVYGYLFRFMAESDKNYRDRCMMVNDIGLSGKVVDTHTGHIARSEATIETDLPDFYKEFFLKDINRRGSSFDVFQVDLLSELIGMGRAWVLTDATEAGVPFSYIIPREQVLDWSYDIDGQFDFIKFKTARVIVRNFVRQIIPQLVIWSQEQVIKLEKVKGRWVVAYNEENRLGYVPIRAASMGPDCRPITERLAWLQVNLMNIDSEVRQIVRNQALSILYGPQGFKEQMQSLSVITGIEVPTGASPPGWAGYPSSSLDAHYKYMTHLIENIYELSNTRQRNLNQSGVSKAWDFLDTDSILTTAANAAENTFEGIMTDWAAWLGINTNPVFDYPSSFELNSIQEEMQNLFAGLRENLGSIANAEIKKRLRDHLIDMPDTQKSESDREIERMPSDVDFMKNPFEPSDI